MRGILLSLTLAITVGFNAHASERDLKPADTVSPEFCMIQSVRSDMSLLSAPIKSREDLARHVREGKVNGSPLRAFSKEGARDFIASLRFNELGLTSYRYDVLEHELSVTEAYLVLSLFGAQDDIRMLNVVRVETQLDRDLLAVGDVAAMCNGGDYPDMKCSARATCAPMSRHICKANC